MAILYVRSTDGSNSDNGSTWALAKATLVGADGIDAAGDTIFVSQSHAESSAGVSISFAGTLASPTKVICGNDAAEPPTAVAGTATVTNTGANNLVVNGSAYFYGITFNCGSAASNFANLRINNAGSCAQHYDTCNFIQIDTHPSVVMNIGASAGGDYTSTKLTNCTFKLASTAQVLTLAGEVHINGGSWASGGSSPSGGALGFASVSRPTKMLVEGFDFSNIGTSTALINVNSKSGQVIIRNCKLPASWSGNLLASAPTAPDTRVSMYNCDNGSTNYKVWIEDYTGVIRQETTIVKTGGATDGTTGLSWKMTSNGNANEAVYQLSSDEIYVWNDTTGASKTVTVDIVHDSVTALTDAEVWLEVMELGTSGYPLSVLQSDRRTTLLTTAASQASSSVTWTTTGLTNPNKQKLEVTFTPTIKGPFICRVRLAKTSKTIYVDPVAQVT